MRNKLLLIFICLLIAPKFGYGQNDSTQTKKSKKKLSFRDPEDNAFDLSSFLLEHNGVLPVVIPITEPAVGYGGGAALLYFHKRKKKYKSYVPLNVSGIMGLATENKTWVAGAFHSHIFGENRVRTITAIIKPDVRYKYYGNDSDFLAKNPLGVNLDSWFFFQKAQVRLGKTKFYVGASYSYFTSNISFDAIPDSPLLNLILSKLNTNSTISSIKPTATYDNRDNAFTPTKGIEAELSLNHSAKWLGSDDDFSTLNTDFFGYQPVTSKLNSAWRFQGSYLLGDAPFYAYPYISLRGVPVMRYQNEITVVAETEWSYNIHKRWWLTAFSGAGSAVSDLNELRSAKWAYNIGTGFRYRIARLLGVNMGTDFAWGNGKDFAFYVVFGTSW